MLRKLTLMLSLAALASLSSAPSHAQDTRYISDKQYIPLRSGAGGNYRIVHRGLPSGTELTVKSYSDDGDWAEISTAGGTTGWLRAQYLMKEIPAENRLQSIEQKNQDLLQKNTELQEELSQLQSERSELSSQVMDSDSTLAKVSEELAQLKQISGKSVQLDSENRRLVEVSETLRSEVDTLVAENQRLQDKLQSSAFIDGALAVLLGVIITLVVPRLWPKRRSSSSWA
ncbi:TIGR04211 family SH3 domain-containing protein [Sediminihaliea albiluteola]|nr:TIGR04211 family SH3 domain-containing protein [Sediminihaliea albiluteola]